MDPRRDAINLDCSGGGQEYLVWSIPARLEGLHLVVMDVDEVSHLILVCSLVPRPVRGGEPLPQELLSLF